MYLLEIYWYFNVFLKDVGIGVVEVDWWWYDDLLLMEWWDVNLIVYISKCWVCIFVFEVYVEN